MEDVGQRDRKSPKQGSMASRGVHAVVVAVCTCVIVCPSPISTHSRHKQASAPGHVETLLSRRGGNQHLAARAAGVLHARG